MENAINLNPYIASGSFDGTIKIWNSEGTCIKTLQEEDSKAVLSIAISLCGKFIVSGSQDKDVRLWNIETGVCIKLTGNDGYVNSVAISPGGKFIASGSIDSSICIWELGPDGWKCICTMENSNFSIVNSIAFSPDEKSIVSGSTDASVRIWNIASKKCIILGGHYKKVNSVAFSPNGKLIVSGSDDGFVFLHCLINNPNSSEINYAKTKTIQLHQFGYQGNVFAVSFSPNGKYIVSAHDKFRNEGAVVG